MERTPINRKEVLKALVRQFGGVETARYYLADALSDIQTIEIGVAENNQMLAAKAVESLKENLSKLKALLDEKDYKPSIEKEISRLN